MTDKQEFEEAKPLEEKIEKMSKKLCATAVAREDRIDVIVIKTVVCVIVDCRDKIVARSEE